jgi:2-polyprenyl-3-methyl-5-hydroxy-6-metoxy-1,4-benzoquinol methylase
MADQRNDKNADFRLIEEFGDEWQRYNFLDGKSNQDLDRQFKAYTSILDFNLFKNDDTLVVDMGAGSGRWTERLLPYFSNIVAIEPSNKAVEILKKRFRGDSRVKIEQATVKHNSIIDNSADLIISLGVLHHLPNTQEALVDCFRKIKPGGYLLCYLYYNLENKSAIYRTIFYLSNFLRTIISKLPKRIKMLLCYLIALNIYWPMAKISKVAAKFGIDNSNLPLHHYAHFPFVFLKNDALDRFGTRIENRFGKVEIEYMLQQAQFNTGTLKFSELEPFYTFLIQK